MVNPGGPLPVGPRQPGQQRIRRAGLPPDQGDFTVTGTIPASVPAGTHKLIAVGSDGRRATATITAS